MHRGFEIVAVTCFGRRRYTDLLTFYTRRCPLIDRHELWINTENPDDLAAAEGYCREHPGFFVKVESPDDYAEETVKWRLSTFYGLLEERRKTIYLRFDDDIVWMKDDAVRKLLDFRIDCPHFFLVFANTLNNSLCSYLHQRMGSLTPFPPIEYECTGRVGWRSWETADDVHRQFFRMLREEGTSRNFTFHDWQLLEFERCSINCIAWFGSDNLAIRELMGQDEEVSLSCDIPRALGRPNCIVGEALVSHFAYHTQREMLEENSDWLKEYQALARSLGWQGGGCGQSMETNV